MTTPDPTIVWKGRFGRVYVIKEMMTQHLWNAVRWLELFAAAQSDSPTAVPRHPSYVPMLNELAARGELTAADVGERLKSNRALELTREQSSEERED